MRTKSLTALFLILSFIFSLSVAHAWTAKVIKVIDGDTITVLKDTQRIKIRFYGIDTPEKRQAFGKAAKRHLISFVGCQYVDVQPITHDRYGRLIALIHVGDLNVNRAMVADGYAWVYRRYCRKAFCSDWLALEKSASEQHLGLWQDPNPMPPWEWRRQRRTGKTSGDTTQKFGPCGSKRYCNQMNSCDEAYFYFKECGLTRLDGDGDGVPCESLCKP